MWLLGLSQLPGRNWWTDNNDKQTDTINDVEFLINQLILNYWLIIIGILSYENRKVRIKILKI